MCEIRHCHSEDLLLYVFASLGRASGLGFRFWVLGVVEVLDDGESVFITALSVCFRAF
jgi:hypothetical protein